MKKMRLAAILMAKLLGIRLARWFARCGRCGLRFSDWFRHHEYKFARYCYPCWTETGRIITERRAMTDGEM